MRKILTFLALAAVCPLGAATNYALRTNGSGFAGDVQASRAIDGKVNTYWGYDRGTPAPPATSCRRTPFFSSTTVR